MLVRRWAAAAAVLCLFSAASVSAEDINDSGLTKAIDCAGGKVSVNGNDNRITVTGPCLELNVMGNQNTVTIESVRAISVMGNQNKVTWKKAEGQRKPSVSNLGNKNSVKKG